MNILFDLVHPADVNLFKNAINQLISLYPQHQVIISYRKRGILENLIKSELQIKHAYLIGTHQKSLFKKMVGLISREFYFLYFLKKHHISLSVNEGFGNVLACKLYGIPFINFEDDYEYKAAFYYAKFFATRDIMPDFIPARGKNVFKYKGCKEIAYLHPKYLVTSEKDLEQYSLVPKQYVFIREIAKISVNYYSGKQHIDEILEYLLQKNIVPVLSIEYEKTNLPKGCLLLSKSNQGYFSILQNALFVISSGDTVAREASLLGIPCIYTGGRDMLANDIFIDLGVMHKADNLEDIKKSIDKLTIAEVATDLHNKVMDKLNNEWDDVTAVILKNIFDFATNSKAEK